MTAISRTLRDRPAAGAIALRAAWSGPRRWLLTLLVALLATSTVAHHLLPEHAAMPGMPGMGHGDHSLPAAAACLGVVEGALLLAPVGGVLLLARRQTRRRAPRRTIRGARQLGLRPPVPPPKNGAPLFLRLAVLRY